MSAAASSLPLFLLLFQKWETTNMWEISLLQLGMAFSSLITVQEVGEKKLQKDTAVVTAPGWAVWLHVLGLHSSPAPGCAERKSAQSFPASPTW